MERNTLGTSSFVSVIVPTYNSFWSLRLCLKTLLGQDTSVPYEIIVSDDGSTDKTESFMAEYKGDDRIKYIAHNNVRLAENRNIGARNAEGSFLIFLDADMLATENFISAHYEALAEVGESGVICGSVPVAQECKQSPIGRYLNEKWNRRLLMLAKEPDNILLMQGGNFSITKEFFWSVGGFAASFKQYGGEDIDFFIKASQQGAMFKYCENAKAYHLVDTQFDELYAKNRQGKLAMKKLRDEYSVLSTLVRRSPRKGQRTIVDKLWQTWRSFSYSQQILLTFLPLLEVILPDKSLFVIYDSLLAWQTASN